MYHPRVQYTWIVASYQLQGEHPHRYRGETRGHPPGQTKNAAQTECWAMLMTWQEPVFAMPSSGQGRINRDCPTCARARVCCVSFGFPDESSIHGCQCFTATVYPRLGDASYCPRCVSTLVSLLSPYLLIQQE